MKALLRLDPNERLTSKEALNHPYFEGLREIDCPDSARKSQPKIQNLSKETPIQANKKPAALIQEDVKSLNLLNNKKDVP